MVGPAGYGSPSRCYECGASVGRGAVARPRVGVGVRWLTRLYCNCSSTVGSRWMAGASGGGSTGWWTPVNWLPRPLTRVTGRPGGRGGG